MGNKSLRGILFFKRYPPVSPGGVTQPAIFPLPSTRAAFPSSLSSISLTSISHHPSYFCRNGSTKLHCTPTWHQIQALATMQPFHPITRGRPASPPLDSPSAEKESHHGSELSLKKKQEEADNMVKEYEQQRDRCVWWQLWMSSPTDGSQGCRGH